MIESKAFYDSSCGAAIGHFQGYLNAETFKKIAEELHDLRKNNLSRKQLNNIEHMKVLTPEIQKWLNEVWFPKAKLTGLKYFAFVVPKDVFGKVSMESANKNSSVTAGIEIQYFQSETEAKAWLKSK
jgi:hypothetical protein